MPKQTIKEHRLKVIGYDVRNHRPGEVPWGNPHKTPVYECENHQEIYPNKPKRGYKRTIL